MPKLDAAGRASYANFLMVNLPRAFAAGGQGAFGWQGGRGTLETARAKALESCAAKGAADCTVYAENLDVVWQGRAPQAVAAPGPFTSTWNYSIVPDNRYFWHGPAAAVGVYVWGHGFGMMNGAGALADARGLQPQPHVRVFNNVGFDVVRFDRDPNADARDRAAGWLEEALLNLRRRGYRRIVVGGQSRGGWNSLQMLAHAGLADAVVANLASSPRLWREHEPHGTVRRPAAARGRGSAGEHPPGLRAVQSRPLRRRLVRTQSPD